MPEGVPAEEIIEAKNNRGTVIIETKARAPREFYISKKDAEKYQIYTRGCGGCASWTRGLARQPHTPECRERFRKAMAEDAKVTSAQERKRESEEREIEKKNKRNEKKERKKRERDIKPPARAVDHSSWIVPPESLHDQLPEARGGA